MPDSVDRPAPLKMTTLPSPTSSLMTSKVTGEASGPPAGVTGPGAPWASCVTSPCCLTRADAWNARSGSCGPVYVLGLSTGDYLLGSGTLQSPLGLPPT